MPNSSSIAEYRLILAKARSLVDHADSCYLNYIHPEFNSPVEVLSFGGPNEISKGTL